jgi:hypothetical protein
VWACIGRVDTGRFKNKPISIYLHKSSGNFVFDSTLNSKIKRMQATGKSMSGGNLSASSMHEEKKERKSIFDVKLFA